jgi:hypothetical protein
LRQRGHGLFQAGQRRQPGAHRPHAERQHCHEQRQCDWRSLTAPCCA